MQIDIEVPEKLLEIWGNYRYKILYGGRSSGKTATIIRYLVTRALEKKTKILCTREIQASIATSTYAELRDLIYTYELTNKSLPVFFTIKYDSISASNGSEFIFKGLARDIMQIKSIPDIDICFIEEAETLDDYLYDVLIPSIRKENSEIIIAFNPRERQSATYQRFIESKQQENELRIEINYPDNPFNSKTILDEIERLRVNDYAKYEHIYLGKVLDMTEDVIFKGHFTVEDLKLEYHHANRFFYKENQKFKMYYGMDFGFSVDPAAIVEVCFIDRDTIYIQNEIYEYKLLPSLYIKTIQNKIPHSVLNNDKFSCDSARPDTIAELRQMGLNCEAAEKNKGSIEAGIEYLKGKKIIIHPDCTNVIYEFYNYRYKIDQKTGNITTDIIDKNNHCIDALRYALHKHITATRKVIKFSENTIRQLESAIY